MSTKLGYPNIALVGKAGSGKSSAAAVLEQIVLPDTPAASYERISFAGSLRVIAEQLWGYDARNDRSKLQSLGMAVRGIDAYTWIRLWKERVRAATWPVVVDDLRFNNEYWAARGLGFVTVRITAPRLLRIDRLKASGKWQNEEQLEHVSETELDYEPVDYSYENDGDKIKLAECLVKILEREARRR